MNVKYYFILNSKANRKGKKFIKIVLRINHQKFEFSTGIFVFPKYWLKDKQRVKSADPESKVKNKKLELLKTRLQNLSFDLLLNDKPISRNWLYQYIFGYSKEDVLFKEFAENYLEKTELKPATKRRYAMAIRRFEEYSPNIKLTNVNENLVRGYIDHAKRKGLNRNTYYKDVSIIKMFLNVAVREGRLSKNPALDIKVKRFPGHREYLTADEVSKLTDLYFNGYLRKHHRNILRYFLFSCYTGLRYSDIKAIKGKDIIKTIEEGREVYFISKKTRENRRLCRNSFE